MKRLVCAGAANRTKDGIFTYFELEIGQMKKQNDKMKDQIGQMKIKVANKMRILRSNYCIFSISVFTKGSPQAQYAGGPCTLQSATVSYS